ncbi:MAG: hypothetical protein M9894_34225 [Planctomycetes bacterium]|nr:hypothetical protein [Planctomycetota bacterium]
MTFAQWELWEVTWRHEDGGSKPRPALLISKPDMIARGDLHFLKLSTRCYPAVLSIEIAPGGPLWDGTGLRVTSYLYPEVQTFAASDALMRRGRANPALQRAVVQLIAVHARRRRG